MATVNDETYMEQYMKALVLKIQNNCPFITDPTNVMVGELAEHESLPDAKFPRVEIIVTKLIGSRYIDQYNVEKTFRLNVFGILKRPTDAIVDQDVYNLTRFASNVESLVFSFNTDKINGVEPSPYFVQVEAYGEIFVENEVIPRLGAFEFWPDVQFHVPWAIA